MFKWITTKQVRNRIFYTLLMITIFQIGTYITLPGIEINPTENDNPIMALMNLSSGGSLSRFGLLALGASPYITASILIQLGTKGFIPYYKKLSDQGRVGQQIIAQHTRFFAFLFALGTSSTMIFTNQFKDTLGITITGSTIEKIMMVIILSVGAVFVTYLGERIDEKGIGQGQSNIIAFGVLASLPPQIIEIYKQKDFVDNLNNYYVSVGAITIVIISLCILTIMANSKEYKYPLQSKSHGVNIKAHYLPIKLLASSVMPIIFASSTLTIIQTFGTLLKQKWTWTNYTTPKGLIVYIFLIFVFSYLYNLIQIDGEEIQKRLQEGAMYIKGVSNNDTEKFLNKEVIKITNYGAPILTLIASATLIANVFIPTKLELTLTGVNILIVIGVLQEVTHQIKGLTEKNNYEPIFGGE